MDHARVLEAIAKYEISSSGADHAPHPTTRSSQGP